MAETPKSDAPHGGDLQGEGNYDAARKYDAEQAEFAKSGKVNEAARKAEEALDGPEGADLERARVSTGQGQTKPAD